MNLRFIFGVPLLIILIVSTGVGCTLIVPSGREATQTSIFEKQRQCVELREQAKNKLDEDFKLATPYFYEIFYSPKTDSCLYSYGVLLVGESPNEIGNFVLADYFSGKTIVNEKYDNSSIDKEQNSPAVRDRWTKEVDAYRPK